jgi:hypothetical protein
MSPSVAGAAQGAAEFREPHARIDLIGLIFTQQLARERAEDEGLARQLGEQAQTLMPPEVAAKLPPLYHAAADPRNISDGPL